MSNLVTPCRIPQKYTGAPAGMTMPISTGNIRRYLAGCACGRAFELDSRPAAVPAHTCNAKANR